MNVIEIENILTGAHHHYLEDQWDGGQIIFAPFTDSVKTELRCRTWRSQE